MKVNVLKHLSRLLRGASKFRGALNFDFGGRLRPRVGIKCRILPAVLLGGWIVMGAGAASWEGTASAAMMGELPVRGLYGATNVTAVNSTVRVTNLDTGRSVQLLVSQAQDGRAGSNLITLSREAADELGIYGTSVAHVRIASSVTGQSSSPRYPDGRSFSGDPDFDPQAFVRNNAQSFDWTPPSASSEAQPYAAAIPGEITESKNLPTIRGGMQAETQSYSNGGGSSYAEMVNSPRMPDGPLVLGLPMPTTSYAGKTDAWTGGTDAAGMAAWGANTETAGARQDTEAAGTQTTKYPSLVSAPGSSVSAARVGPDELQVNPQTSPTASALEMAIVPPEPALQRTPRLDDRDAEASKAQAAKTNTPSTLQVSDRPNVPSVANEKALSPKLILDEARAIPPDAGSSYREPDAENAVAKPGLFFEPDFGAAKRGGANSIEDAPLTFDNQKIDDAKTSDLIREARSSAALPDVPPFTVDGKTGGQRAAGKTVSGDEAPPAVEAAPETVPFVTDEPAYVAAFSLAMLPGIGGGNLPHFESGLLDPGYEFLEPEKPVMSLANESPVGAIPSGTADDVLLANTTPEPEFDYYGVERDNAETLGLRNSPPVHNEIMLSTEPSPPNLDADNFDTSFASSGLPLPEKPVLNEPAVVITIDKTIATDDEYNLNDDAAAARKESVVVDENVRPPVSTVNIEMHDATPKAESELEPELPPAAPPENDDVEAPPVEPEPEPELESELPPAAPPETDNAEAPPVEPEPVAGEQSPVEIDVDLAVTTEAVDLGPGKFIITEMNEPAFSGPPKRDSGAEISLVGPGYYVQLGTWNLPSIIQSELHRLDGKFPLVVKDGKTLLVGPLSEGESNAILERFKADGWLKAFVTRVK